MLLLKTMQYNFVYFYLFFIPMKKALKHYFFILFYFCGTICALAGKPVLPPPTEENVPPGFPIDSFLVLLVILGIGFVFINVYQKRKRQFEN